MKKVYLYARVASESQSKPFSMQRQIQILKDFAQKEGYKIIRIFQDYGSAMTSKRPAFEEMIHEISQGKIKYLLCMDLSRLSRDFTTFAKVRNLMDEKGLKIITPSTIYGNEFDKQKYITVTVTMIDYDHSAHSNVIKRGLQAKLAHKQQKQL